MRARSECERAGFYCVENKCLNGLSGKTAERYQTAYTVHIPYFKGHAIRWVPVKLSDTRPSERRLVTFCAPYTVC
jgi:hypothetical protein